MTAEGSLRISVGPGLAFQFDLPRDLLRRIERFLEYFAGGEDATGSDPVPAIRVSSATSKGSGEDSASGSIVLEEPPLVVRRVGDLTLFEMPGARAWCDAAGGRAGICLEQPSESELDLFVGMVLAPMLIELAAGRGWLGVHAAGVEIDGVGILLPGPSGAGKSTMFGQVHRAGHGVLSDDLLWLRLAAEGPRMYPFPRGTYSAPVPAPTTSGVALRAIVCPVVAGAVESRLVPLAFPQALKTLIDQGGFLTAGAAAGDRFRALVGIARAVPTYRLEAGRRRTDATALLAKLASQLATRPATGATIQK